MYRIQVRTPDGWMDVRPSGKDAAPYEYAEELEAHRMARMCYPGEYDGRYGRDVRVVRVDGAPA